MTSWQVVIELGRKFDVLINGDYHEQTPVLAIPFGDRESAESAQREIRVYVRPVHDAGGEDYRPVVQGEIVEERPVLPWDDPETMKRDLRQAVRNIEASGGTRAFDVPAERGDGNNAL